MSESAPRDGEVVRDWCATTFVVWNGGVLLHRHKRLGLWLPCGGHVEPNELPDDAAVRETLEESGVAITLVGERTVDAQGPIALVRPRGIQLESIAPGHEHVDLIYFGVPAAPYDGLIPLAVDDPSLGWYGDEALRSMDLTPEVRAWCTLALKELDGNAGSTGTAVDVSVRTVA